MSEAPNNFSSVYRQVIQTKIKELKKVPNFQNQFEKAIQQYTCCDLWQITTNFTDSNAS